MLRHCVQSWTRDPREDLSTPRLTFFFLKAEPLAASLPAFLLLESAISTSAVVPSALCRYDEFEWVCVDGNFIASHLLWSGTSDAGLSPNLDS